MSAPSIPAVARSAAKRGRRSLPALLLIAVVALAGVTGWLLSSTSGLQWLAATLTQMSAGRVSFTEMKGALLGSIEAQTVIIGGPDLRVTAHDVKLDWRAFALLTGKLEVAELAARDVEVLSLPASSPYPADLRLPLALSIHKLGIGTLRVVSQEGGAAEFSASNISAKLESDGQLHLLRELRANTEYGKLTASGRMDGVRPFTVQAQASLVGLADFTGSDAKDAHISATVSGNLKQLNIKAQGSGAGLDGNAEMQLTPYSAFPLAALHLQASGLNPRAFSPDAPMADLTLQADLRGNASGMLEGSASAKNINPASIDHDGLPLLDARSHVTLSADVLKFDNLALHLAGGASISGHLDWQRKQLKGSADLAISHLDPAALDTRLRSAGLNGSMKLSGDDASQHGVLKLNDGALHLDALLNKSGETLTLEKMRLARGQAELSGEGKLELNGRRAYRFSGKLQHFDLAEFLSAPRSDLNAALELAGTLEPQATGTVRFMMKDSSLAQQPVSGNGIMDFTGMGRGKVDAELHLGDNRLSAKGRFGAALDRLQLELAAPVLGQLGPGFGGVLNIHASLAGNWAKPDATLSAEGSNLAMPDGFHLAGLTVAAGLHGEVLTFNASATDYTTTHLFAPLQHESGLALLKSGFKNIQIGVKGTRAHHEFNADLLLNDDSKITLGAIGGLDGSANSFSDIQWQGSLTKFSGSGRLPFRLLAVTPFTLGRNHVSFDTAGFSVAGGLIHIDSLDWTPQRWSSRGNFTGIGLRAGMGFKPDFIARNDPEFLRLGGEWDITSAAQLAGNLRVARESGDWVLSGDQSLPLGLKTFQFSAHAENGRMTGELTATGERLGEWHADVSMPLAQSGAGWVAKYRAPLSGKVHISAPDLSWLGPFINDGYRSAGQAFLDAEVSGTLANPRLRGNLRGENLGLSLLDQGVRLQQGTLAARFEQQSLYIDTLNFIAPYEPPPRDSLLLGLNLPHEPGKLTASGTLDMGSKSGALEISASHMPLTQRADRWIVASGNGHVSFKSNALSLGGNIIADAGLISQPVNDKPRLSDDVVFSGQQAAPRNGLRISVDASLDLGEHFYLRASGLEARLVGKLNVRDTPGQQLRVTGTIAARDAGFEAYSQHLTVERGIVNFQGPLYDPGLNILALRKGLSVEAGVEVTGTALHPSVRLVSTPTVPDFEKLSWIVLGRPPNAGGTDAALLLNAAGSILGSGSGGITGQIKQTLGVDELSLRQGENTGQSAVDNPLGNQIATVGKRLSARTFLSYEQSVTAIAGVTKLTYALTPRVSVVTQTGADSAIDVFYTFSFD